MGFLDRSFRGTARKLEEKRRHNEYQNQERNRRNSGAHDDPPFPKFRRGRPFGFPLNPPLVYLAEHVQPLLRFPLFFFPQPGDSTE